MTTREKRIVVKGAREHNLKNLSFEIPRNKLIVFHSGSLPEYFRINLDSSRIFGKEKIIALPFDINIYPSSVSISYQEDFVVPHGGKFASRLIFVPLEDNFF